ncbi:MAG TPA: hypothetical protein VGE11_21555 [Pseudonocardia sp.]
MTREPDPTGFDDIVAALQREGGLPQWPEDGRWPGDDSPSLDDRLRADGQLPRVTAVDPFDRLPGGAAGEVPDTRIPRTDGPENDRDPGRGADFREGDGEGGGDALPLAGELPADPLAADPIAADPLADEHFVPPEPPPLPRLGPPILVGLTLIVLGLVLVTFPGWVGVPQLYGLPLGLVAIASGLGWLVLRLWPDNSDGDPPIYLDDPDDPDGGAVL